MKPRENSVFANHDINGLKSLARLRLNFSQLHEHKFRHNFSHIVNLMCSCGVEPEATLHYLLHCDPHSACRKEFLNGIYTLNLSLKKYSEDNLLNVLLYGAETFTFRMNKEILICTISFLKKSDRFSGRPYCS